MTIWPRIDWRTRRTWPAPPHSVQVAGSVPGGRAGGLAGVAGDRGAHRDRLLGRRTRPRSKSRSTRDLEVGAPGRAGRPAAAAAPAERAAAEEGVEDVAEAAAAAERVAGAAAVHALGPEACRSAAPLLGVGQHLVGVGDLLEPGLGLGVAGVGVGVQLAGQAPVGPLDLVGRGVAADAEQLVVVGGHVVPQPSRQPVAQAAAHDGHGGQRLRVVHAGRAEHADGAGRLALDVVGRDDERALGQRRDARSRCRWPRAGRGRARRASRRHDDELLLEDAEHLAHGLDGVERRGHAGRAADEDVVGLVLGARRQGGDGRGRRARRPRRRRSGADRRQRLAAGGRPIRRAVRRAVGRGRPAPRRSPRRSSSVRFSTTPFDSTTTSERGPGAERRRAAPSGRSRPRAAGPTTTRGVVGEVRRAAGWCRQHLLELAVGPGEERPHLLAGRAARARPVRRRWSTKKR